MIRIGVLTDISGPYRDVAGPTSIVCVRQSVQEFTAGKDLNIEVLSADHQNKPDIGSAIARQWFDQKDVDMIVDINHSALALAVSALGRERNKVILPNAATSDLTGPQCSPNTVHWAYDTYMLARSTATRTLKLDGNTWFLITPNYTFGHQLARDVTRFVTEGGGRVVGSAVYPFPETTDFSAYLHQARASGANVLGLCNGGADAANSIKQAREFGLHGRMRVAALAVYINVLHGLGLDTAQGLLLTESFYWNLNERTRAFLGRIRPKTPA
ncbi:MAG: ABC transporter substrate-binding protein, partial [Acetobacteraceae bacterium]|nr:ABC transporter substrate-binding protein [Acetobacteraceae bacterium]